MKLEILEFFRYDHLPPHMQVVSRPFCELAQRLAATMKPSAELSVALRKLLESKDAAVRALILTEREAAHALAGSGLEPLEVVAKVREDFAKAFNGE